MNSFSFDSFIPEKKYNENHIFQCFLKTKKNNDDNNQRTRSSTINEDHHQNVVMSLGGDSSTEKALFNLRRRDFFLDDYKNKEIQIVDTVSNY